MLIISVLLGNFLGPAISTVAGQKAQLDVVVAAMLLGAAELISWGTYRRRENSARSLVMAVLNAIKIGAVYSLFVEALKLGS